MTDTNAHGVDLGYIVKNSHVDRDGVRVIDEFQLLEISLVPLAQVLHPDYILDSTPEKVAAWHRLHDK